MLEYKNYKTLKLIKVILINFRSDICNYLCNCSNECNYTCHTECEFERYIKNFKYLSVKILFLRCPHFVYPKKTGIYCLEVMLILV